ncbi:MAG: signal peptide peptidase SppA [Planctomycetota bacterium]
MDFNDENNFSGTSESPSFEPSPQPLSSSVGNEAAKKPKKKGVLRVIWGVFKVFFILINIMLFLMLISVFAVFMGASKEIFVEGVIRKGPATSKIAVVTLQGMIDEKQSRSIYQQIKMAREDEHIKGLVLRVNSPGGTISASDQIHNEILRFRKDKGKPIIAFMQGVAASGGYYVSVSCDKIMAEPTVITGSIGVIMNYFVVQQLLEEKLGIEPVIIKGGSRKDWPNPFKKPTEEQLKYLDEKIVKPAHERFIEIVDKGRPSLTISNVRRLADGSIYNVQEALEEKLVDGIGYLDDAIDAVLKLAGVEKAKVVEYSRPFSLSDFLGSKNKSSIEINKNTLYELGIPQLLYLWNE